MSKITLEVLKEKGASESCIKYFERFCPSYKKNKMVCPVELIKDNKGEVSFLIYQCIDTLEELREVVECIIETGLEDIDDKKGLYYTFEYCPQLYKQDLELFKKAVKYHFVNNLDIECILTDCKEVLALLPELHKELKNYVNSCDALKTMLK